MNFTRPRAVTPLLVSPLLVLIGCASIQSVAYTPQPDRISDPQAEITRFIMLNTTPHCLAEPQFEERVLDVKFVCSNGIGHFMARLDQVESIQIEQFKEWYRVILRHSGGIDDFSWSSKRLEDVQRAADAFDALVHQEAERPNSSKQSI